MSSYFCHDCAVANGFLRPPPKGDSLTDNVYKLDKYIKHTIPLSSSSYKTIVTGIASESYQNLVLTTVASGHVQVDGHNRVNIVWIGSESTGIGLQGEDLSEMLVLSKSCAILTLIRSMDSQLP
jgi:hypothetical protein